MHKTSLLLILSAPTLTALEFSVISYNVRTSNAPDVSYPWTDRKQQLQPFIEAENPDFIGTQEASPEQFEFFQQALGDTYGITGECAGECYENERPFLMYKKSEWNSLEFGSFALEIRGSNTWNLEYKRSVSWQRFQHKSNSISICLFNTHFDMTKGHLESSKLIVQERSKICKSFDFFILTGDLNANLQDDAIHYLKGIPLISTLQQCGYQGGTFIGPGVFTGPLSSAVFDYIFIQPNENIRIIGSSIIDSRRNGQAITDHAIVKTTFCSGSPCAPACG
uniref:Uncharacterized protein AlNc14C103G6111 n=1 Tax=Albugo laibachii Nc14 TaxID=890382 RepID=F0WHQ4_9STRA|nr:conserved hypothetical protein [Albugo laibachii Nc14]|eukprot:CCA20779.1 conserved hypothetical protein [Albugo laibachii Nc14]